MSNIEKALLAEKAIKAAGYEKEMAVRDLLSDLMHYADINKIDFSHELQMAEWHYTEELKEVNNAQTLQ